MKRKVYEHRPSSAKSLEEAIKRMWTTEITVEYCAALVRFMPARIKSVLENKGGYSKY